MKRTAIVLALSILAACGVGELEMGLAGGDPGPLGYVVEHGDAAGPGDGRQQISDPPGDATEPPGDPTQPPGDPIEPPGDPTEPPGDATEPPGDPTEPPGDPTEPPGDPTDPTAVEINPGWLGGACDSAFDCNDPNIDGAICLTEGFVNGFCTQTCTQSTITGNWICPDTDYDGTLATMSRCVDGGGMPRCASECDYDLSPTGCRPGYECTIESRYGDPSLTYPICLPVSGWPVTSDVGGPCLNGSDCTYGTCLRMQDGYCSKADCHIAGCPEGSRCFTFGQAPDQDHFCLDECASSSECRQEHNYVCDSDDTCWPAPPPTWNSSVGSSDCSSWWGNLSPCDSTPDQYIVVNKGARNIALCSQGTNIGNFHGALGFSALGDKNQEGDGKTPEGVFYVARQLNPSQYYRAFLLSYPDVADAARGYADGLIGASEQSSIVSAQGACIEPPQTTELGGMIEIHGESQTGAIDWTWGCIATENSNVDALWATIDLGDTIVVVP